MTPLTGAAEGMPISAEATLEDALREMLQAGVRTAHMLDASGKPAGTLTMEAVMAAMVTPAALNSDAPAQVEPA
jgi:glycine betaine/proline transport system ATP-binding protein